MLSQCPCCSNKPYDNCCKPYIANTAFAPTPEALMRSRYTAYSQGNIDYIFDTMQGDARIGFDKTSTSAWAKTVRWLGLTVIDTPPPSGKEGIVEFIARYEIQGNNQELHERSRFIKHKGQWYYVGISLK